jgi:glycosyltransferase involved in cell wall biosynthesis
VSRVTVAIPVRDGGEPLERVLDALERQTVEHELLVCDSGSSDGSVDLARAHGARMLEIPAHRYTHGGVRNLLTREAQGDRVALLSQDAQPAHERWLESLLAGFDLSADVAIVYGPYQPRPDASLPVRLELERWFSSLSPDGEPRLERLAEHERLLAATDLVGRRGFFSDANACLARAAWEQVPFREIEYAEDRALALDMLRAGYAKAFVPAAAVIHSHDYTALEQLRRSFDEWRGLLEVYGWREPVRPRHLVGQLRGGLGEARRALAPESVGGARRWATLGGVAVHHLARLIGAALGSRADVLPAPVRRALSLERRSGFRRIDADPIQSSNPIRGPAP